MKKFYPYDPNSTERITETATIEDAIVLLNHIPKKGSIQIDGFNETSSVSLAANQFRCLYSEETHYREANRIINFNSENDGRTITISYIVVGSPILADTMNEIKDHLENSTLHNTLNASGGEGIGFFKNFTTSQSITIAVYGIDGKNIDDEYWEVGSEVGQAFEHDFESNFGRPPEVGDIVYWYIPGNDVGYALRANDKWFNLSRGKVGGDGWDWRAINPLLTIEDREKLDNFSSDLILGTTPSTVEGAMWLSV